MLPGLRVLGLVAALLSAACAGTPSPLAPSIRGSIGVPHEGMLTDAVPLPRTGEGYALLRNNGRNWGNPRLVAAIQGAAKTVARARPGGARLMVGDISARWGGGSSGHRSHRTGRWRRHGRWRRRRILMSTARRPGRRRRRRGERRG